MSAVNTRLGTAGPNGTFAWLNVTAAQVVYAGPCILNSVSVIVGGSAVGQLYDFASTTSPVNEIGIIPDTITTQPLMYNWPCEFGIVIEPGAGQTLAIAYTPIVV